MGLFGRLRNKKSGDTRRTDGPSMGVDRKAVRDHLHSFATTRRAFFKMSPMSSPQPATDRLKVIDAVIWVDREGQKPIVIGAKGSRLKRIGQKAREELNARMGKRLHLNLWVKVREDWADDARALAQLGME